MEFHPPLTHAHSPHPPQPAQAQPPAGVDINQLSTTFTHNMQLQPTGRAHVHIIYDYTTLPLPPQIPLPRLFQQLRSFAANYGELVELTLPILSTNTQLTPQAKQICHEYGVKVEEISPSDPSNETFLLTRLLRLTLELQHQQQLSTTNAQQPPITRTSVIVLSNHSSLASSLTLMRHSSLFAHIILIHGPEAPQDLIQSASSALTLQEFLAGAQPKQQYNKEDKYTAPAPTYALQQHPQPPLPQSAATRPSAVHLPQHHPPTPSFQRPSHVITGSPEDSSSITIGAPPTSLLGLYSDHPSSSPSSSGPLLPTPGGTIHSPSMRFFGGSQQQHGGGLASSPPAHPFNPQNTAKLLASASCPSSPMHRPFFPSSQQHSPQHGTVSAATSPASFFPQRGSSDRPNVSSSPYFQGSTTTATTPSNSRTRACINAYQRIIAYCESEKLIPRESVLKKRLVDSKIQLNELPGGSGGFEFEEFLSIIVNSGTGIMEGEPPQRILWPRNPDGTARHFPCADFFTPVSRLSAEQNAELLEFLYQLQPEVERGRFGFANWLAAHGPPFVRLLPHGVLVELVQLLLNRKILLFRKGRVSVASRTEANEAANLGLLFSAADFQTPSASVMGSPTTSRPESPRPTAVPTTMPIQPIPGMEAGIWEQKPMSMEDPWRLALQHNAAQRSASGVAHRPSLSTPLFAVKPTYPSQASSFSTPSTRISSPVLSPLLPGSVNAPMMTTAQDPFMLRVRGGDIPEKRKSIASLQPLPLMQQQPSRPIHSMVTVGESIQQEADAFNKSLWPKDDRTTGSGASSGASSLYGSRRNSLTDVLSIGDPSWRLGGGHLMSAPFESSTGFVGESMDACDPAAVLAAKLARLNQDHITSSAMASTDELARFTATVQYRPCFHFEKSGAAHTPEWVCCVAFNIGTRQYQMKSAIHSKKDLAKNEVCMKILQMLEDESIQIAPHTDATKEHGIDSVVDLARLLNFLQQAPVVYYLTRTSPSVGTGGGRFDRGSRGRPNAPLWNGTTRIQVKSVNILTGEAQPTVNASTPFTHTVTASSKNEVKEMIAANLLQQIQRARVVNPALFSVLSAARHNIATQGQMSTTTVPTNQQQPLQSQPRDILAFNEPDSIIWSQSSSVSHPMSQMTFSGLSGPPAAVDMTRMPSTTTTSTNASLFSMHTPVPGRAFSGISAIGLQTPVTTPLDPSAPAFRTSSYPSSSSLEQVNEDSSSLLVGNEPTVSPSRYHRSISNDEAESTSTASAESALDESAIKPEPRSTF